MDCLISKKTECDKLKLRLLEFIGGIIKHNLMVLDFSDIQKN